MATTVALEQRKTLTTLSVGEPMQLLVSWWLVCAVAGLLALSVVWRLKAGPRLLTNMALVGAATLFCLVTFVGAVEHVVASSPYLSYQLGIPEMEPQLGWFAVVILTVVCLLCFALFLLAQWWHGPERCSLPTSFRIVAGAMPARRCRPVSYLRQWRGFRREYRCVSRGDSPRWRGECYGNTCRLDRPWQLARHLQSSEQWRTGIHPDHTRRAHLL